MGEKEEGLATFGHPISKSALNRDTASSQDVSLKNLTKAFILNAETIVFSPNLVSTQSPKSRQQRLPFSEQIFKVIFDKC